MRFKNLTHAVLAGSLTLSMFFPLAEKALADEGMWTFDNLPLKQLKEKYNFTPTSEWLEHVRLSSVRFNDGGSGSFVSPDGLVMTNHHVAMVQLQKMSTPEKDYVANGFYAATREEEAKCADLELNVLVSFENVTDRVRKAAKPGATESEALKAREAEISKIEKESLEKTGLRSDLVNLYQGGEFWLYRYKKYTDVRLVMAPERQIAFFGGDSDNFTFPRYNLDMAFFRAYEDGKPVKSPNYLKWNSRGPAKDELVFVSGHPGSTERLLTHAQLEFQRDVLTLLAIKTIQKRIQILQDYSKKGPEQARRALGNIFFLQNSLKVYLGMNKGLQDKNLIARHKRMEDDLRKQIASNPEWQKEYGDVWKKVEDITRKQDSFVKQQSFWRVRSQYFDKALRLVRYVAEIEKKDETRLDGYHDSQLEEFKLGMLSPAPIYADLEEATLAGMLEFSQQELGPQDPFIKAVLGGKTPAEVAKNLVSNTKLGDVMFRKTLFEGGKQAIANSQDPFIVLAHKLDPMLRELNERTKKEIDSVLDPETEKLAKARFAVFGKNAYPDATFTLRLSYGTVKGYPMNGTQAPYKTTLFGLYDRSISFDGEGDYAIPQRYKDRKDKLDLTTPFNYVFTCDIIGGNSGSPVINKNGELVGLVFDGNIESLTGNYVYEDTYNRALAVHPAIMMETLRKIYDADALANEIEGKSRN